MLKSDCHYHPEYLRFDTIKIGTESTQENIKGNYFTTQKVFNLNRIIGLSLNLNAQELQERAKGTLIKTAGEPVQRFPDKIDACVRE